jgi:hypothetical protein
MIKRFITSVLCSLIIAPLSYAQHSATNEVFVTLYNEADTNFTFTGVTGANSSNDYSMKPMVIAPHEQAVLSIQSSSNVDVAGNVHLSDNDNRDTVLTIIDYRKFHSGQSIFSVNTQHYVSTLVFLKPNPSKNPLSLMYSAATLSLHHR